MTAPPNTPVPPWRHADRRRLAWFAVAAVVALAVLAWVLPIPRTSDADTDADRRFGDAPAKPPPEDLTAFLDVERWGISLREINARIAAEQGQGGSGLNPALKALGYVGLVVQADANTVLLTTTEGTVARLEPGDTLPDVAGRRAWRVLDAVGGNSITLRAADGGEVEVLELAAFPRPPPRTDAGGEAQ